MLKNDDQTAVHKHQTQVNAERGGSASLVVCLNSEVNEPIYIKFRLGGVLHCKLMTEFDLRSDLYNITEKL
jgi:hypothetical protein